MKTSIESGLKIWSETQFTNESKKEAANIQAIMLSSLLVSLNCFSQTSLSHPWCACKCYSTFGLSPAYSCLIYYVGTNYLWIYLSDNKCKVRAMLEPECSKNIGSDTWQHCPRLRRPLDHGEPWASDCWLYAFSAVQLSCSTKHMWACLLPMATEKKCVSLNQLCDLR